MQLDYDPMPGIGSNAIALGSEAFGLGADVLARLEAGGQVVVRYVDGDGRPTEEWPHNPNGSPGGIAGICDPSGRLFGLMPHPDAYLYPFHHPQWSKNRYCGEVSGEGEGLRIFRNGVDAAAASLSF